MTYEETARLIARRTGLPYKLVRHVLDTHGDVIAAQLKNGSEVHFRGLLKLQTYARKVPARPGGGPLGEERTEVRLRVRPMPALRKEMKSWRSTSTPSEPTKSK